MACPEYGICNLPYRVEQQLVADGHQRRVAHRHAQAGLSGCNGLFEAIAECQLDSTPVLKHCAMVVEERLLPETAVWAMPPEERDCLEEDAPLDDLQTQIVLCSQVQLFLGASLVLLWSIISNR